MGAEILALVQAWSGVVAAMGVVALAGVLVARSGRAMAVPRGNGNATAQDGSGAVAGGGTVLNLQSPAPQGRDQCSSKAEQALGALAETQRQVVQILDRIERGQQDEAKRASDDARERRAHEARMVEMLSAIHERQSLAERAMLGWLQDGAPDADPQVDLPPIPGRRVRRAGESAVDSRIGGER